MRATARLFRSPARKPTFLRTAKGSQRERQIKINQQPEADSQLTDTTPSFIKKEQREELEGSNPTVTRGEIEAYNMFPSNPQKVSQATTPRSVRNMTYAPTSESSTHLST